MIYNAPPFPRCPTCGQEITRDRVDRTLIPLVGPKQDSFIIVTGAIAHYQARYQKLPSYGWLQQYTGYSRNTVRKRRRQYLLLNPDGPNEKKGQMYHSF